MIEWIIWGVSFLSLFVGVFWLHVASLSPQKAQQGTFIPRKISFIIPARNEEKGLWKTVYSVLSLDYPKELLEIIIVDHGSTDKTATIGRQLIQRFLNNRITLVYKEHHPGHTKAHAFNEGLRHATGEFVACLDADCIILEHSLTALLPHFSDPKVGAVISTIKVYRPRTIFEKIQHLEYIFATFMRGLMSKIDTLHVTPGALSVYRRELFDLYGGFEEGNVTEDLEIAMRLRAHGYSIRFAKESLNYTVAPSTFSALWRQRVRWFRGFIFNSVKYRGMLFQKKFGLLGTFQYPLNLISVGVVLLMFALMLTMFLKKAWAVTMKIYAVRWEYFLIEKLPSLKETFLNLNLTLLFPIMISFVIGLWIYHLAHKSSKEPWRYPVALVSYLTVYPVVRSCHWMTAVWKELLRTKRKW